MFVHSTPPHAGASVSSCRKHNILAASHRDPGYRTVPGRVDSAARLYGSLQTALRARESFRMFPDFVTDSAKQRTEGENADRVPSPRQRGVTKPRRDDAAYGLEAVME
jgi:hypothetical protein